MHKIQKIAAGGAPQNGAHRWGAIEVSWVVPIVRVTVTGDPLGVTLEGENVQFAPSGKLLQPSLTSLLNPYSGVTMIE